MKFKKLIVAFLVVALSSFALVGCGDVEELEEEAIEEEPMEEGPMDDLEDEF